MVTQNASQNLAKISSRSTIVSVFRTSEWSSTCGIVRGIYLRPVILNRAGGFHINEIARACNFFYLPRVCGNMLRHVSRAEEVMRECDTYSPYKFYQKTNNAVYLWAESLGWTSAVTCCNIFRGYHWPVVFRKLYISTSILLVPSSLKLSFTLKCNHIQFSYYIDGIFC